MSEEVYIQYELGQHGWSNFRLNVGTASVVVGPFGYCSDALGDLVRAALMIATSGSRAEVSFDAEPMEWRLIAGPHWYPDRSSWTDFSVRVLTFQGLFNPPAPEVEGNCLFEAQCSADDFTHAVLRAAQAVWDQYGADGYDAAWGGPLGFPLRALHALRAAISVEEPRSRTGWQGSSS
jgi:hypothetical protein